MVLGRLSVMMVAVSAKVAGVAVLLTLSIQLKLPPVMTVAALFVLTIVRSGAITATVCEQVLLASLVSATAARGSTAQVVAARGLTRAVGELPAVTGTVTVTVAPVGIVTEPPDAVQVRSLVTIAQEIVPTTPPVVPTVTVP